MQETKLKNTSYYYLVQAFADWLDILGYSKGTIYNQPRIIGKFLHYLETQGINKIHLLQNKHLLNYQTYLNTLTSSKTQLALSSNYINTHFWSIETFLTFLHHKGVSNLPAVSFSYLKIEKQTRDILTEHEIKELYEIAKNQESITQKQEAINYGDLVLLSVYYACGLRRSEGTNLSLSDINLDTKILHVKKGKGGKQRLIPFNKATAKYLHNWIYQYRDILIKDKKESHLFINYKGKSTSGNTLNKRLQDLIKQSENTELKEKNITRHSLRQSIATHVLANRMDIQKVQQFLGHSSLGTTEIYTHLIEEKPKTKNQRPKTNDQRPKTND